MRLSRIGAVATICKRLKFEKRWEVQNPQERKGGLLVAWNNNVTIKQIEKFDFCMELLVDFEDGVKC